MVSYSPSHTFLEQNQDNLTTLLSFLSLLLLLLLSPLRGEPFLSMGAMILINNLEQRPRELLMTHCNHRSQRRGKKKYFPNRVKVYRLCFWLCSAMQFCCCSGKGWHIFVGKSKSCVQTAGNCGSLLATKTNPLPQGFWCSSV